MDYDFKNKNLEKKAAFEALSDAGFDFDTAVSMVKAASDQRVTVGEVARNMIAPTWAESKVAKDNGKTKPGGLARNTAVYAKGHLRMAARGAAEGFAGAATGAALSTLAKAKPASRLAAQALGAQVGTLHGTTASAMNQVKEFKNKYAK